jgi:DUF2075 family protein
VEASRSEAELPKPFAFWWVDSPQALPSLCADVIDCAGVIIGADLGYDPVAERVVFQRENYHDKKGKENNPRLGLVYSDEDLLEYVANIYRVLLTRGIRGTYLYVVDPALRQHIRDIIRP